jgi:hemerythrin-like domain-containing protein
MRPTEMLKKDHQAILLMIRIIGKVNERLRKGEAVDPEHLMRITEFIQVFADQCHHGKEEDLLFPAMEEAGVPREGGPIGVMLAEHVEGRGYVRGMAEAAAQYKAGDSKAGARFADNAGRYGALLSPHIDKEDNILYMIADMHLSEEKQQELVRQFDKVEEKIGAGRHEEFHQLLHRLEAEYLK